MNKQNNVLGGIPTPPHFVNLMINLILEEDSFNDSQKSPPLFIIDNSVGDGRFLFEFAKLWRNSGRTNRKLVLHGLDIDQKSINDCKIIQEQYPSDPKSQILFKVGNALIGYVNSAEENENDDFSTFPRTPFNYSQEWLTPNENDGYDICLGNPPFGLTFTFKEKHYFKQRYKSVDPEVESYILFVERSVQLLKEGGILALLIPNNFTTNYRYKKFRTFLFNNVAIQKIIMLTDNVFPEVAVETCILMAYKNLKTIEEKNHEIEFSEYSKKEEFTNIQKYRQDELWKQENHFIVPLKGLKYKKILETINRDSFPLGEIVKISRGIELGFNSDLTNDKKIPSFVPLVAGRNVHRSFINERIRYIRFDKNNRKIFKDYELYTQPKILLRRIGNKLIAAYDPHHLFCVCDVYILTLKLKWKHLNIRNIEVILNSSLLTFYLNQRFLTVKKLFPKIPINFLRQLPVKLPQDSINQEKMQDLINRLDEVNNQGELRNIMKEINHFIYSLFGLTDNQIEIIVASLEEVL